MKHENSTARTLLGTVTSDKMKDTIVVKIDRQLKHSKYHKYIKRSSKIHAHDAGNTAKIGDLVLIQETSPISKLKSWKLVDIRSQRVKNEDQVAGE